MSIAGDGGNCLYFFLNNENDLTVIIVTAQSFLFILRGLVPFPYKEMTNVHHAKLIFILEWVVKKKKKNTFLVRNGFLESTCEGIY